MKCAVLFMVGLAVGCSQPDGRSAPARPPPPSPARGSATAPPDPASSDSKQRLIALVGPRPRAFAALDLSAPMFREQIAALEPVAATAGGSATGSCGMPLDRLTAARIAVGEPLRIAAEIDGPFDAKAVRCVLGNALMSMLEGSGLSVRDRAGGVAIGYRLDGAAPAAPDPKLASDLVSRCVGSCAVARLGPGGRELWIDVRFGAVMELRMAGPEFRNATAIASAISATHVGPQAPVLAARDDHGTLVVEMWTTAAAATIRWTAAALLLRRDVLEAFRIPASSMAPTLIQGDQLFIAKGAWRGEILPGDLLVFRTRVGADYVKRLIARGGQTVTETDRGIAIDGQPVPSEVVDPAFQFDDTDDVGVVRRVRGTLVREHLGDRSYVVLHTEARRHGSWTVPPGELFFLGDHRENSNDSRFIGTIPESAVKGRVVGLYYASRDGLPDWNRIGTSPE